jgi:serine phosphatase RsbU (regulator of sigma subunit)
VNKNCIVATILIGLCWSVAIGQAPEKAGLWNRWSNIGLHDTLRISALDDLIWDFYLQSNPDSALLLVEEGLLLASGKSLPKEEATLLNTKGQAQYLLGRLNEAREAFEKALAIQTRIGHLAGMSACENNLGNIHNAAGRIRESIAAYERSIELDLLIGSAKGAAQTKMNIAIIYMEQGDLPRALDLFFEAMAVSEKYGDKLNVANCLNNIANAYLQNRDYDLAIENLAKAADIQREINDLSGLTYTYHRLGSVNLELGNHTEAEKHLRTSLFIAASIGDERNLATAENQMGNLMRMIGLPDSARHYFVSAVNRFQLIGDIRGQAMVLVKLGGFELENQRPKVALDLGRQALGINQKLESKSLYREVYDLLYQAEAALGNYREALRLLELNRMMNDSLFNEQNTKEMLTRQFLYETEILETLNRAELEKQEAIRMEEGKRKDQQRNGLLLVLVLVSGLGISAFRSYRRKIRDNQIITEQKQRVEEKNREILQSIAYARRLQEAVLPPPRVVKEFFADSFLLYLPKDIVSGDFYWMESCEGVSYFAVGDCTGHGVPGAMLSVIGLNGLNRALSELHITEPKDILEHLTSVLKTSFERSEATVRDGMDISVCALDTRTNRIVYAGANSPLWVARNGTIEVYKPDRRPVGFHDAEKPFTQQEIQLLPGDTIYLLTDGYADQIGGPKAQKMKTKLFRERLTELSILPLPEQRQILFDEFIQWQGKAEQTDDVCVMGVRI